MGTSLTGESLGANGPDLGSGCVIFGDPQNGGVPLKATKKRVKKHISISLLHVVFESSAWPSMKDSFRRGKSFEG